MAPLVVPYGYGSQRVPVDRLDEFPTWARLHPEFKRRVLAMFVAAGGHVGVGTGWRSTDVQKAVFLQRHVVSPSGKILWDGKRWALKPGMAPAAPPGLSFHEGVNNGMAMAIDIVGDLAWADTHAADFGLVEFSAVNKEPWHFQCAELPHGVKGWTAAGRPQPSARAAPAAKPATPTPPDRPSVRPSVPPSDPPRPVVTPTGTQLPILHVGEHGPAVATMQLALIRAGQLRDTPGNRDGRFGPGTEKVLKRYQARCGLNADGICGPATWRKLSP